MGSIMSKIDDDIDDYRWLCNKYKEKYNYNNVYSEHYYWLNEKHDGKTKLSYEEYVYRKDKDRLTKEITNKLRNVEKLEKEIKKLKQKQIC